MWSMSLILHVFIIYQYLFGSEYVDTIVCFEGYTFLALPGVPVSPMVSLRCQSSIMVALI